MGPDIHFEADFNLSVSSQDRSEAHARAFVRCEPTLNEVLYQDVPSLATDDELAMLVLEANADIHDKVVHGIVAYISTLGFEMISGRILAENNRVSFRRGCFRLDEDVSRDLQLFTAYFKRPPARTSVSLHRPISSLLRDIQLRVGEIAVSRSADSQSSLCSEDLAGIKELSLLPSSVDARLFVPGDFPQSRADQRANHRLLSQPLQGFGHRPAGQQAHPLRYRLVVIGVNQAGFLSFVHSLLLLSGFRIVCADIETIRGSYASNTYVIETYSVVAERILRANFQCIVPLRSRPSSSPQPYAFHHDIPSSSSSTPCGVWLEDGLSGFYGIFKNGKKNSFGKFWRSPDRTSLATYVYEGDFVDDAEAGFGFRLEDEQGCVQYSFGFFRDGKLVDGSVLCPFEPPVKSVRVDPAVQPDQCVYRVLIQRAEFWRRQLPKSERPTTYLPVSKLRDEIACTRRAAWMLFAESPVPSIAALSVPQVAALFDMCGLAEAAKAAFGRRIDGALLEAMTERHLEDILSIHSAAQRNLFISFLSVIAKAHSIDRHMRQPASVVDALLNPSISGKLLPLDQMRMVDSLGEGAYGKVVYAEFNRIVAAESAPCVLEKTMSMTSLVSSEFTALKTSSPSLTRLSRFSPNAKADRLFVALKEQVGSSAQLENSCELIREWATLNALPHENIVKLEGICADANGPMFKRRYLATALVEASLPSLIYTTDGYGPAPALTPLLTIQLAGDIASGLAHMHSLHLMHGDIKSPNVLVDLRTRDRPVGRLCDLGHAAIRVGPRPQRRMCTFGWAAPESLRDADTDVSADVWSWAVVCWEMYTKEMPWKSCSHAQLLAAVGYCGLDPSGHKGARIPQRVRAERTIAALCQMCWNTHPTQRPSMDRVLHVVDKAGRMSKSQAFAEIQSLMQ